MIEGFFLDRVDVGSDDLPVDVGDQPALTIFPYAADADLGGRDVAAVGAEETLDLPLIQDPPEHRLSDQLLFLGSKSQAVIRIIAGNTGTRY